MPTGAIPVMKLMTRHSTIVLATAFVLVLAVADVVVAANSLPKEIIEINIINIKIVNIINIKIKI